jgi:hypothetical protein
VMWPAMSDSLTGSRSSQWHPRTEGRDVAGSLWFSLTVFKTSETRSNSDMKERANVFLSNMLI